MSCLQDVRSVMQASPTRYGVEDACISSSLPLYRVGDDTTVEVNTWILVLISTVVKGDVAYVTSIFFRTCGIP